MLFVFENCQQFAKFAIILILMRLGVSDVIEDVGYLERIQEWHGADDFRHRLGHELDMPAETGGAGDHSLGVFQCQAAWGSNWPHGGIAVPMPNDADLLDFLLAAAPKETIRKQILADNPARLYGWPAI